MSSDRSEQEFAAYFREMPWLAMPYALRDLKTALGQMFQVTGIPALILIDGKTGQLISKDGRYGAWGPVNLLLPGARVSSCSRAC